MSTSSGLRASQDADAGSSYIGSAADLMIGLLFIFIIMVAYLALQIKKEKEVNSKQQDPRVRVTKAIYTEIVKSLPTVEVNPERGIITLPEDILFDVGSSMLKESAIKSLSDLSGKLSVELKCYIANQNKDPSCKIKNPDGEEIDTIFIEGHTDNLPMNRPGGNLRLSLDRAISVNNILVKKSDLDKFRNNASQPIFSYSAYADSRPKIPNNPSDAKNRRVDLRIILTHKSRGVISTSSSVNSISIE